MIDRLEAILLAFWRSEAGREPVRDFREMNRDDRAVVGANLRTLQFGWPVGVPLVRKLADGIFEVRSSLPSKREARLLFTASGKQIVVLHGFIKKSRKTPTLEIELARKRLREMTA
jgi:phage-related protein